MTSDLVPMQDLPDRLETEAQRWEGETRETTRAQQAFRDGVVSGYRWARTLVEMSLETENDD